MKCEKDFIPYIITSFTLSRYFYSLPPSGVIGVDIRRDYLSDHSQCKSQGIIGGSVSIKKPSTIHIESRLLRSQSSRFKFGDLTLTQDTD